MKASGLIPLNLPAKHAELSWYVDLDDILSARLTVTDGIGGEERLSVCVLLGWEGLEQLESAFKKIRSDTENGVKESNF